MKITRLIILLLTFTLIINTHGQEIRLSFEDNLDTLEVIHASEAWEITKGSEDITIAVIDSGLVHSSKVPETINWVNQIELDGIEGVDDDNNGYIDDFYGWDFVEDDNDTSRHNDAPLWGDASGGHGTQVTSIISAIHDSNEPLGIAPNAKIMSLRVNMMGKYNNYGSQQRVVNAIDYAIENNATIINLSIHFLETATESLKSVLKKAVDNEIPVVIPTNNYMRNIFSTEINDYVIGVNSQWESEYLPGYPLPKYDIFADGLGVPTTGVDGAFKEMDGTSPSIPQVSGTIALMLSMPSDLPLSYIGSVLQFATTKMEILDLGDQPRTRYVLNVHKAVNTWHNFDESDFETDENGYLYEKSEDKLYFPYLGLIILVFIPVFVKMKHNVSVNGRFIR
ncbi:MAG: S8 family serine peptidase [Candidatus Kariarchaeaceae archaeon]|jgi:hypothetical protein